MCTGDRFIVCATGSQGDNHLLLYHYKYSSGKKVYGFLIVQCDLYAGTDFLHVWKGGFSLEAICIVFWKVITRKQEFPPVESV